MVTGAAPLRHQNHRSLSVLTRTSRSSSSCTRVSWQYLSIAAPTSLTFLRTHDSTPPTCARKLPKVKGDCHCDDDLIKFLTSGADLNMHALKSRLPTALANPWRTDAQTSECQGKERKDWQRRGASGWERIMNTAERNYRRTTLARETSSPPAPV